jgi:glycosyltransferase involved in cell wall biosynthesis
MARQKNFSVVIPAWNEGETIGEVVRAFRAHPLCSEVIVVSDGSKDNTAEAARSEGAEVIALIENVGKGGAMEKGVAKANSDIIFFSDADILGLDSEIISGIALPVLEGAYPMSVGITGRNIYWFNKIFHFFPLLAGQRVLTKELWYAVPEKYRTHFKVETALNYYSKRFGRTAHFALFPSMHHVKKELKYGMLRGFYLRVKMIAEIVSVSVRLYIFERILNLFSKKTQKEAQEKITATYPR